MKFEWDENKAKENIIKHDGITFDEAKLAFFDDWAIEEFDESHSDFREQRFTLIGLAVNRLLRVTYTIRDEETIRIISAEKARPFEERAYNKNRNEYDR
ncbi:MAG TPA: BrnT family toxin [Pyrinomonadaceae bacterium]|nr:BrnT family toxin [Pyrinomonadaceae bacterium]